jgi:hypothetical protein
MSGGKNQRVGKIVTVLDQTATRVSSDHGSIRWGDRGFLEVPN